MTPPTFSTSHLPPVHQFLTTHSIYYCYLTLTPSPQILVLEQVRPATRYAFQGSTTSCQAVLQSFSVKPAAPLQCAMQKATVVVRGTY
jgi:hypothetical protein